MLGLAICQREGFDLLRLLDDGLRDQFGVLHGYHYPMVVFLQGVAFLSDDDIAIRVLVDGNADIGSQHHVLVVSAPAVISAAHGATMPIEWLGVGEASGEGLPSEIRSTRLLNKPPMPPGKFARMLFVNRLHVYAGSSQMKDASANADAGKFNCRNAFSRGPVKRIQHGPLRNLDRRGRQEGRVLLAKTVTRAHSRPSRRKA
jgi:hypothetical protein